MRILKSVDVFSAECKVFTMMDHTATSHSPNQGHPTSNWIDLADLTSIVASLKGPDRHVDAIIDAMLAGKSVVKRLTTSHLKDSQWLSDESPAYTSGGSPLRVLLQRRGLKSRSFQAESGVTAVVSDPFTELSRQVTAHDETVSTILALLLIESARD